MSPLIFVASEQLMFIDDIISDLEPAGTMTTAEVEAEVDDLERQLKALDDDLLAREETP